MFNFRCLFYAANRKYISTTAYVNVVKKIGLSFENLGRIRLKKKHRKLEFDKQIKVQSTIKIKRSTSKPKAISNWRNHWSVVAVSFFAFQSFSIINHVVFPLRVVVCFFRWTFRFRWRQWILIATTENMCRHVRRDFELSIWFIFIQICITWN